MHIEVRYSSLPFKQPTIIEGHKTSTPTSLSPPPPAYVRNEAPGAYKRWIEQTSLSSESLVRHARHIPPEQKQMLEEQNRVIRRHLQTKSFAGVDDTSPPGPETTRGGTRISPLLAYESPAFSGLGAVASAVSSAVAAVEDAKFRKATGEGASTRVRTHMAQERMAYQPFVAEQGIDAAIKDYAESYRLYADGLVMGKIYSVIAHVLSKERDDQPLPTAAQRREYVREILRSGEKSMFRGTTLLPQDLSRARRMFEFAPQFNEEIFAGSKSAVLYRFSRFVAEHEIARQLLVVPESRERLTRKAVELALKDKNNQALQDFLRPHEGVRDYMSIDGCRRIPLWAVDQFSATNPELADAANQVFIEEAARQMKRDGKYLRSGYARILNDCMNVRPGQAPSQGASSQATSNSRAPEAEPVSAAASAPRPFVKSASAIDLTGSRDIPRRLERMNSSPV